MSAKVKESSGPLLVTRPEARTRLGLSRRNFDTLVAAGDITLEKLGPRYYVPVGQIDGLIARWTTVPQAEEE